MTEQPVNPRMLVLAREALSMSQSELAEACGISQSLISKVEAGLIQLPADKLQPLATVLQVLPAFLCEPAEAYGLTSVCLHFRKRQTLPVKKLREIIGRVNKLRIQVGKLLDSVEIPDQRFPPLDVDEFGSPEAIARLVRASWGIPPGPVHDLLGAIENNGGIVILADFGTLQFDAVSQWAPAMPPLFFVNQQMPGDRVRFTLAHELGHVVMHRRVPSSEQEEEANRFASEFLMPADEIKADLRTLSLGHLATLKAYWKVSIQALLVRARALGCLTDRQYRTYFMRLGQLGYRRQEPVSVQREEPKLLRKILAIHEQEHGYSVDDLARLAMVPTRNFVSQFFPERGQLRLVG